MNKYFCALLIASMLIVATPTLSQGQTAAPLNNGTVIKMVKDGLAPEIIVAKINTSESTFDTSPEAMSGLKQGGIPDAVVLAMVQAGAKIPVTPMQPAAVEIVDVNVIDGQQIEVELARVASGEDLKVGDIVDFTVTQPVIVNGVTIIDKGASARATITTAKRAGHWGRAGKLEWAMKDVMLVDGNRVPVRFTERAIGDSKGGTVAVAAVATSIFFGPLALLWGLKKGKPSIIPPGNRYPVFIHGDTNVKGHRST